jgi:hypothetical protein
VADRVLTVRVTGETSGLSNSFKKASKESETFGSGMQKHIVGGLHQVAKAATYAGGIIGVSYVAALGDGVRLAASNQVAMAKLQKSVQNSGKSWKVLGGHLEEVSDKMATMSGFTNTDLETSLAQLITTTGKAASAQKIQGEAMDLARAKGVSLAQASTIISKVWNGNVTSLTRLGIALPKSTAHYDAYMASTKHATAAGKAAAKQADLVANRQAALAALQKKFGGSWQAYANTSAGALSRIKAAAEILLERLGKVLLPYLQRFADWFTVHLPDIERIAGRVFGDLGDAIKKVVDWVKSAIAFYGRWSTQLQAVAVFVGTLVVGFEAYAAATKVIAIATKVWTAAQIALDAAMSANPIGIAIVAAAALAAAFVVLWKRSATFRDIVRSTMSTIQSVFSTVIGFIRQHWGLLLAGMTGGMSLVAQQIINHWGDIKHIANVVVTFIVNRWGNIKSVFSTFGHWVTTYIIGPINAIISKAKEAWSWISKINIFGGSGSASTAASNKRLKAQSGNAGANIRTASAMLSSFGWGQNQLPPLVSLWNQESGWSQYAYNAKSGATGIPQSLPYNKMPQAAWLPSQGGQADPKAQIGWGLGYIKNRVGYGSPAAAWAHEQAFNWYDNGGVVPGPRGVHRPAMVAGGETILPTHKSGAWGALTIVVNMPKGFMFGSKQDWSRMVREGVIEALRTQGPNAFRATVGGRLG